MSTGQDFIGYNMFTYCNNSPVMRADDGGTFGHIIAGAAVGALVGAISGAIFGYINAAAKGDDPIKGALTGAGTGAITGAITGAVGAALPAAAPLATKLIAKTATSVVNAYVAGRRDYNAQKKAHEAKVAAGETSEKFKCDVGSVATSATFGAVGTALGFAYTTGTTVGEVVLTGVTGGNFASLLTGVGETFTRLFTMSA